MTTEERSERRRVSGFGHGRKGAVDKGRGQSRSCYRRGTGFSPKASAKGGSPENTLILALRNPLWAPPEAAESYGSHVSQVRRVPHFPLEAGVAVVSFYR